MLNKRRLDEIIEGFIIQRNVISALVYRELKTRVSQVKFGILGVFLGPLGVMLIFLIIFSIFKGDRGAGLNIFLFLASGIVMFTFFQDIAVRGANAMQANEALFFYRPVKPIDTIIARTIVESLLYLIVFFVIILGVFLYKEEIIFYDFPLFVSAYLAFTIFCFSLGLVLMVAAHFYNWILQIIPLFIRPLWLISGVFVGLRQLPQWVRPYASWNPLVQCIELIRHSFSINYIIVPTEVSIIYLWQFSLISLFISLWIYQNNEIVLLKR